MSCTGTNHFFQYANFSTITFYSNLKNFDDLKIYKCEIILDEKNTLFLSENKHEPTSTANKYPLQIVHKRWL